MTDLIDVVQKLDPGSELVELYEVTVSDSTVLYFHPGVDANLTTVQFRDRADPAVIRTYTAFPIEMTGVEFNSDGASPRPTLTVANVTAVFSNALGTSFNNDDLIGQPITKRITLKKYLYGESADANPPIEFPIQKYIIDRISSETSTSVSFELASPFDLSGIKLPNRSVLGKYCSWEYQGEGLNSRGGCIWNKDGLRDVGDSSGTGLNSHKAYFTSKDIPLVSSAVFTADAWASGTSYSVGDTALESGSVYMVETAHTASASFATDVSNWERLSYTSWSSSTSYAVNDYLKNGSAYYRCNTAHTSSSAFSDDSTKWDIVYIYTSYNSGTTYAAGDYVEATDSVQTTVWKALKASTGVTPAENTSWTRGEMCGKKFSSCKCRFQYIPRHGFTNNNSTPSVVKDTSLPLPFGAFPGARKFR